MCPSIPRSSQRRCAARLSEHELSHTRTPVNSIVLLTNGISFAIQAVLLLCIGAWSDFGTWRPNITIFFTVVAVAVSFAWLGVEDPAQWRPSIILYILGRQSSHSSLNGFIIKSIWPVITYQCSLTFYTAAFPGLARDLPEVKRSAEDVQEGRKG
jgi:hypothetical protein